MLSYEQILRYWFPILLPYGQTLDEFELHASAKDRSETARIIVMAEDELDPTVRQVFGLNKFPRDPTCLSLMDERITPAAAEWWMKDSDPDNPGNFFKVMLTVFAVHFGNTLIAAAGGKWFYARWPNFFRSTVRVGNLEILVFDALMKKCSQDFGHEKLTDKFAVYLNTIQANLMKDPPIT